VQRTISDLSVLAPDAGISRPRRIATGRDFTRGKRLVYVCGRWGRCPLREEVHTGSNTALMQARSGRVRYPEAQVVDGVGPRRQRYDFDIDDVAEGVAWGLAWVCRRWLLPIGPGGCVGGNS